MAQKREHTDRCTSCASLSPRPVGAHRCPWAQKASFAAIGRKDVTLDLSSTVDLVFRHRINGRHTQVHTQPVMVYVCVCPNQINKKEVMLVAYNVLLPFEIVGLFDKSRFIIISMYLDITIYVDA
jgi:hypothetical protein